MPSHERWMRRVRMESLARCNERGRHRVTDDVRQPESLPVRERNDPGHSLDVRCRRVRAVQ